MCYTQREGKFQIVGLIIIKAFEKLGSGGENLFKVKNHNNEKDQEQNFLKGRIRIGPFYVKGRIRIRRIRIGPF